MTTFPEINGLNLKQCRAALAMAEINILSVNESARPELAERIIHLRDRIRGLEMGNAQALAYVKSRQKKAESDLLARIRGER